MSEKCQKPKTPRGQRVRFRVALAGTLRLDVLSIVIAEEPNVNMANKTYGTVSPVRQKAMSGLEFVKGLVSGALPLNMIAQTLGCDVVEAESGRVAITLDPTGAHLNPWGTVHGGLTATLLDSCMGLAIQSMLEKGVGSTTLEFKISLVRAITLETGQIRAEGRVLNCGRRVGMAEGRVTDAKSRLLAHDDDVPDFPELTFRTRFLRYHRCSNRRTPISSAVHSTAFPR
jgi:uncharacterized protein (TIGR00369 family)